jgi:beta-phosphoglucomutase-like phosphatase (HAD superfamily)
MDPKSIQLVAFDCDGVMFDTRQSNSAYYNTVLAHFGLPAMTAAQFDFVHMHTVDRSIDRLFEAHPGRIPAVRDFCRQLGYEPFIRSMIMEPDLKALLAWLKGRFKTAVATNRTTSMARVMAFHQLEGAFDTMVCALDVDRPKPHPDLLLKTMERLGATPDQTVYIGDSPLDMAAARSARTGFIAYQNPALDADIHIGSLGQVRELLSAP